MVIHPQRRWSVVVLGLALFISATASQDAAPQVGQKQLLSSYGKLPLSFEPCFEVSCGAAGDDFLVHGRSHSLFVASTEVVLAPAIASQSAVRMKLTGAKS